MDRRPAVLPAVLLAVACGASDPAPTAVEVHDSAGVTIVVNPGVHMADSTAWVIDTAAAVRIGVVDGPEEYTIGRLAGLLHREDGSILVADALAENIRVFNADGNFVQRVGGKGEGPGEFTWLSAMYPYAGDSIVVLDHESSRANVLDGTLAYGRRYRPTLLETRATPPFTSHRLQGFFADGSSLFSDYLNGCGAARMEGFCQDSVAFFRADGEGNTLARFGSFVYSRRFSRRGRPPGEPNVALSEPFPQAFWEVRGSRFYYADARHFEVRVFRADGSLERVVRVRATAPGYDRAAVLHERSAADSAEDPERAALDRAFTALRGSFELPDTLPWFSDMLVDAEGNIWLRQYSPPGLHAGTLPRWLIFDPEGHLRWSVRTPYSFLRNTAPYARLKPQLGRDQVLAAARDELGVESVMVYPLRKAR